MTQGHTPGPWRWSNAYKTSHDEATYSLVGPDGFGILSCDGHGNSPQGNGTQGEADADLIAAAPELLEACQLAIPSGVCLTNKNIPDDFTVALDCTMGDLRKIAAAIAKATGAA